MSERAYTVKELDDLRAACETRWLFGTTHNIANLWARQHDAIEKAVAVEQIVRTHMLAGHTAEDIYAEDLQSGGGASCTRES